MLKIMAPLGNFLPERTVENKYNNTVLDPILDNRVISDNDAGQENLIDDMVGGASCAPVTDYFSYASIALFSPEDDARS